MTQERAAGETSLDVLEGDIAYARPDGLELLARIYRPSDSSAHAYPTFVAVHGGAWNANDRVRSEIANHWLAASGLVVVSVDFRQGPEHQHPSATSDIVAAVRWANLHAADYGGDAGAIGLLGNSSGGHLALLAALRPHAEEHGKTPLIGEPAETEADGTVSYLVAHWPVSDPLYRYRHALKTERESLIAAHLAYFGDEATMEAASVPRILEADEAQELPPLLLIQPGEDQNVPLEMTQSLMRAYQQRGGHLEYAFFPGQPHAFTYEQSEATEHCLAFTAAFIHRQARLVAAG